MAQDFNNALTNFIVKLQDMVREYHSANYPNLEVPTIYGDLRGRKYIRIVRKDHGQQSVHCFVERETGNILKAASWKAPAKHARGNIYADDPLKGVGIYGANYLR